MAGDNSYKREIVNMAIDILREGKSSTAGMFHTSITDAQFADWSSVTGNQDVRKACFNYEPNLLQVLQDIRPDFSRQFADLSDEIMINKEIGSWGRLFEVPTDFLDIVAQIDEGNKDKEFDNDILTFNEYSHVVKGSDEKAWKCKLAHTAASANKPITGASYLTYWELYNTDDAFGADWVSGWAYKASQSGKLLATNNYSNIAGNSAYIQYLAYVQAGISDKPQFYPPTFKQAVAVLLASAMTRDKEKQILLVNRYEALAKPRVYRTENQNQYEPTQPTMFEARTL